MNVKAKKCQNCVSNRGRGASHNSWKGGRYYDAKGYVRVYAPEHPNAVHGRYVLEHKLVMEETIGRLMVPGESVHHKNGIRDDNRPENLELWIKPQPIGIRAEDAVEWAREIIRLYG